MSTTPSSSDPTPLEVPSWLKSLPLAPEYRPTLSEFSDPISFILKIEKEASTFGICKIISPLPPPPKKTTVSNFNRSFAARNGEKTKKNPTFTTRQQQIGFCPRRPRPVQKPVWQSGETYTLQQFESKAKQFERAQMKKFNKKNPFLPLEVESLFWSACADKPFSVEYANDMPGSGFAPNVKKWCKEEEVVNVGGSGWNMRGVSRAKGSLLRFMKEEVPGVTSPMIYVAMMFSWFAWHVEDHELHSLNYLHMGAAKTWYGVPRDAGQAFEEVVRVHGYGGEVNPLVTFTILGEKTTVMSPEVLISAGIPCCRLVQNAGEFVVTFPGAYHCGFSHVQFLGTMSAVCAGYTGLLFYALHHGQGFNCAEAANIATPGWLRVAKEAAIRRASINYPPMVSHFQLLYALALSLCSRSALTTWMPLIGVCEPRSSRLKDKTRGEGEMMIKEIFMQNVIETNDLLNILISKGSSCIVLPQNTHDSPLCPNSFARSQSKMKPRLSLGLCSREEALEASRFFPSNDIMLHKNAGIGHLNGLCALKGDTLPDKSVTGAPSSSAADSQQIENEKESAVHSDGLLDQGLLSCVTCGILSFTCVAVVHPREAAARYLMSADCGFLNNQNIDSRQLESRVQDRANDELGLCSTPSVHVPNYSAEDDGSDVGDQRGVSALALLASAYGDSSDSEDDGLPAKSVCTDENNDLNHETRFANEYSHCPDDYNDINGSRCSSLVERCQLKPEFENLEDGGETETSSSSVKSLGEATENANIVQSDATTGRIVSGSVSIFRHNAYNGSAAVTETSPSRNFDTIGKKVVSSAIERTDKDSSRMHVFCLEHALEVEKLLHPIGGVNIMLLCHPDYPKIEAEAKSLAEELESDYEWKDIDFKEAVLKDLERIRASLEDEESIPTSSDWAVKLGINLYYSANLSKSPLYSKQMPYNAVIYRSFGCSSPNNSPIKPKHQRGKPGRQKKIVVAGKWCGKVWMSNQVHPFLAHRKDAREQEVAKKHYSESDIDTKYKEVETEVRKKRIVSKKSLSAKRKKQPLVKEISKKPKCTPQVSEKSSAQSSRVLRSCRKLNAKYETEEGPCTIRTRRKLKVKNEEEEVPSTHLRTCGWKSKGTKANQTISKKQIEKTKTKKVEKVKAAPNPAKEDDEVVGEYACNVEGCTMSFSTKKDLALHKKDICPEEGCGKKFFSHKYLAQHRKVHLDDRPLECPWKGCKMRFKWAWARTEHIRVHTGDRPYICRECSQTFRFVSDFSRHKRKTGHVAKRGRR